MKWVQSPASTVPFEPQHRSNGVVARPLLWLTGIALLALALRLYQIGAESLWVDEWLSLRGAKHMDQLNRHRPLFYLFLRGWSWFGSSDVWMRLPAVIFGVIAVLLLYPVARRLADTSVALIACLIMAVAVPELDHSQEVRMYTMASALTLSSIYMLLLWMQDRKLWALAAHVMLSYAAFLTTPTTIAGLLLADAMAAVILLYQRRPAATFATITGCLFLIVAWWPLKRYARLALHYGSLSWISRPTHSALLTLHGDLLTGGLRLTERADLNLLLSLLTLVLIVFAIIESWRGNNNRKNVIIVAAWFYSVAIGMYATSLMSNPVWSLRYFHYAAPALYVLLGFGLVALARWHRSAALGAGIALIAFTVWASTDYYYLKFREDWRGIAARVTEEAVPRNLVAVIGPPDLFLHYYKGAAAVQGVWPDLEKIPEQTNAVFDELFADMKAHSGRTWLVIREDPRLQRVNFLSSLEGYLKTHLIAAQIRSFPAISGNLYLVDFAEPSSRHLSRERD